jgi:hypothetical protein
MDATALDARVTGYESPVPSLNLPDEKDRHVLAAAIQSKASVIVTNNLKDFPRQFLQQFEVEFSAGAAPFGSAFRTRVPRPSGFGLLPARRLRRPFQELLILGNAALG